MNLFEQRHVLMSKDRLYRYLLEIIWDPEKPLAGWCGCNPSKADEWVNDHTIRKEIHWSQCWGAGGLVKVNMLAYRSTSQVPLYGLADPIGEKNTLDFLAEHLSRCRWKVAVWGKNPLAQARGKDLFARVPDLQCLRINGDGSPEHPLRIPYSTELKPWKPILGS